MDLKFMCFELKSAEDGKAFIPILRRHLDNLKEAGEIDQAKYNEELEIYNREIIFHDCSLFTIYLIPAYLQENSHLSVWALATCLHKDTTFQGNEKFSVQGDLTAFKFLMNIQ